MDDHDIDDPQSAYLRGVNRDGIAFQAAVVRHLTELAGEKKSAWRVEATELPVQAQGRPFHVDIVLRHHDLERYLIVECKRVQPKFARWAFARAGGTNSSEAPSFAVVETIHTLGSAPCRSTGERDYQLGWCPKVTEGLELKDRRADGEDGAADKTGRGAIQQAVDQALRGVNGMVNRFVPSFRLRQYDSKTALLPVVVTTAKLWTVPLDLASASLADGNLLRNSERSATVPYVQLDHSQSPQLKHDWGLERNEDPSVVADWLGRVSRYPQLLFTESVEYESLRTVLICNAQGLVELLAKLG